MATNALRIVIINDDPEDLALLRRHLVDGSERTLTVIETSTGEEGIRACLTPASPRPDCVIVDLHLPDMGCLELLNRLKNSKGMVLLPIVLLIDSGEECKAATDVLRAGAQDYIAKSWLTADGLSCVVEHAIERFEILRRLRKKRKRVKNALKEADKRKDEFLARLAHELRNPLAAIRTATHILRMKGPDEPDQNWGRDVIERQVKHLTRLIDDLLDVSRISTGKVQLKRAPLDVREIVSRSVEAVSSFMTAKQHELRLELPTEPLATHADPARLEQILCNLLTNAAKYTDHGGAISLSGEREGLNIVIRIKDNGVGIAPEKLGRVFSLFTQIDSNLDRPQGGLGMGLTLVKMLVEMHEGRVTATSGGPGLGSEFTITLPALLESTRPASELGPGNSSDLRTSSERPRVCVLVIDDNVDAALGMAMLVQTAGYEVRTVHDGPSALEILRNYQPEFVLIDLGLPGMSSYELAQAFRRERSLVNATLVAISGYGQPKDRDLSRLAGFDYHLIKPIDLETLLPILTSPAGTSRPPR